MYVPKKRSELSKDFYREEINKLIKATEEHFGVEITKEKLAEAIKLPMKHAVCSRKSMKCRKAKKFI